MAGRRAQPWNPSEFDVLDVGMPGAGRGTIKAPARATRGFGRLVPSMSGTPRLGYEPKGFAEEAFPYAARVAIKFPSQDAFEDSIKGLSPGHSLWRARQNWPGATIEFLGPDVGATKTGFEQLMSPLHLRQ